MGSVFNGRYTAAIEGPFVVFLIGMRVNKLLSVRKWWPTMMAMNPMLQTLNRNPEKGYLGGQYFVTWRGVMLVTYWRSHEDLDRFARNPSDPHLSAWKTFNKNIGPDGSVGIWHETYLVGANEFECVYGNMPRYGLAAAGEHVPAVGNRQTARLRLGRREDADGVALTANRGI